MLETIRFRAIMPVWMTRRLRPGLPGTGRRRWIGARPSLRPARRYRQARCMNFCEPLWLDSSQQTAGRSVAQHAAVDRVYAGGTASDFRLAHAFPSARPARGGEESREDTQSGRATDRARPRRRAARSSALSGSGIAWFSLDEGWPLLDCLPPLSASGDCRRVLRSRGYSGQTMTGFVTRRHCESPWAPASCEL